MATTLLGTSRRVARGPLSVLRTSCRYYAKPAVPQGLKINGQRLWDDIHYTCQWGTGKRWGNKDHETGMSRLSLSDSDKQARDWFVATTKSLGCQVTVDAIGNIFAVRPGKRPGPATFAGSHLDTQPTGGRYDGILGVCAGIEMLRTLQDNKIETDLPVGVINWTNEEGARFPMSMMASGVWAGKIALEDAHGLVEVGGGGRTVKEELRRIGYLGDTPASYEAMPIGAHFELHIEQGPRLENAGQKIGIVTGVQAYKWFDVKVEGRDCHTGTTPFDARSDALLTAARLVDASYQVAKENKALASTGIFKAYPGSVNTVPGLVEFSLDVRGPSNQIRDTTLTGIRKSWTSIENASPGIQVSMRETFPSDAIQFDPACLECVRDGATDNFGDSHAELQSGAGHDSVFTSKHAPTAMIFVPCRKGVSHHPEEYCAQQDCANGAQILTESVLRYDQLRAGN